MKHKMAFRAEKKLAAPATDEASEVKADVEPEMAFLADNKFSAPAIDEASENKDDVVPEAADGKTDGEAASVHIVHLIRPEGEEPEAFDIKTLTSVIGSEAAAKEAVVYHYTHAASGFSAWLTPKQVAHLSVMWVKVWEPNGGYTSTYDASAFEFSRRHIESHDAEVRMNQENNKA